MPSSKNYVRNYKQEYKTQKARNEKEHRNERQRARRDYDKRGIDRTGKDIAHNKPLRSGGKNSDGTRLMSPSKNRSRNGHSPKKSYA
jgi:hypothetical protein